jgi:hypothetical protein
VFFAGLWPPFLRQNTLLFLKFVQTVLRRLVIPG